MKKEFLKSEVDKIKWFHRIELPFEEGGALTTPGIVDHTTDESATIRYGLPVDLSGLSVLDVGCYDGYFSFLSEKRGAVVSAIDPLQGRGKVSEVFTPEGLSVVISGNEGFELARKVLDSRVKFAVCDLGEFVSGIGHYSQRSIITEKEFDVVLYYGVLYHTKAPILELEYLYDVTKENGVALIETAISCDISMDGNALPLWQFKPGFDNDPTNYWYPSLKGVEIALLNAGFNKAETIFVTAGGERATIVAHK